MSSAKPKRFTLRGVLDGLRSSVSTPPKNEMEIEETLRSEHFQVCKTVRYGFPFQPTSVAFDPVQHILAIGTKTGSLRILGRPGVDSHCMHDAEVAITQILFLVNEGALVTVCSDDSLHLWNFRQKRPEIVHSLKFQRERITFCHLPFQSKWLYIGTERGNVHVVNIESFILSGYVINWNKAIELSRKTHPGPIVHLSDNPMDPNKLLIGFESGTIVFWDLKNKIAESRYSSPEALRSVTWHHEGKQFMCSHSDGSLTTWNFKIVQKPINVMYPHAKFGKDGKPDPCKPITRVDWKSIRNGEPLVIFSGGMSYDRAGRTPSITVMNGKSTTVLEMEHNVVDFVVLSETPWANDFNEPYAIVVLLQNDLVVVDLTSPGYPCFENPYPMDLHESPVTACQYYADCPHDLIPALYSVGLKQKKSGFSEKRWPIQGGEWGTTACSYPEIIITGHADGSVKFWDASAVMLQVLYKLKTAKMFDKPKKSQDGQDDDPFAIQIIYLLQDSRMMCIAGATHCILFRFSKQEANIEIPVLEVSIVYEIYDELDSPEYEYPRPSLAVASQQSSSMGSYSSNASDPTKQTESTSIKVKTKGWKWSSGFQPELVCMLNLVDGDPAANITSISVNSTYGLLAFGNESGLAIIDYIQKTCLLNLGTPDLYGSMDPYQRAPRSPRSKKPTNAEGCPPNSEECKSPTTDPLWPSQCPVNGAGPTVPVSSQPPSKCKQNTEPPPRPPQPIGLPSVNNKHVKSSSTPSSPSVKPEEESFTSYEIIELTQPPSPDVLVSDSSDCISASKRSSQNDDSSNITSSKSTASSKRPAGMQSVKTKERLIKKTRSADLFHVPKCVESRLQEQHQHKLRKAASNPDLNDMGDKQTFVKLPKSRQMKKTVVKRVDDNVHVADVQRLFPEDAVPCDRLNEISRDLDGPQSKGLLRRMSTTIKSLRKSSKNSDNDEERKNVKDHCNVWRKHSNVEMLDLREDNKKRNSGIVDFLYGMKLDRNEGTSFSRSRSSSMSSLENVTKEAIQSLTFADSYTRKTDNFTCPCLWVGTSLGSVIVIVLNLPPSGEQRVSQPVIVSPSGTIFRLKGAILAMSFLDCNGVLIQASSEAWKEARDNKEMNEKPPKLKVSLLDMRAGGQMSTAGKPRISPTSSTEVNDRQFAIICSEKQARVMSLPSQTCAYKVKITETSFVIRAEVVSIRESVCLMCYVANGHIMAFSLPSLKPLCDVTFLPLTDYRMARTFNFSNNGHAMFLCSPTELQKITYSADISETLNDMLGDLFLACDTPEAPKQSFFKNLFSGGQAIFDREELFGESSGKASKGLAKHIPGSGLQHLQGQSGSAAGEVARARQVMVERGEKLGDLGDKTEQMMTQAESFAQAAHQIMTKYRDKKWYQF
ncbi:syntaxin-binding protein 5-like isoform X2 [Gigantopelta aegis]|uniref:syntaxin-binding protein 5-like isoform X2 n=1 Tax=Gigantopelta aegis TaxID=1735272 RepID=UPI001B889E7A|nr:syntaxin-binding protein 5-like isoform X2 [Gigantopelta aegis]